MADIDGLDERERRCVEFLLASPSPVTGRRVAAAVGISPTTAGAVLEALHRRGAVSRRGAGRSLLWSPAVAPDVSGADMPVVVVLTALPLELDAVRALLADPETVVTPTGSRFVAGTMQGKGTFWRVHVAEIGMGNAASAVETTAAVGHLSPRLVVFVGVAGGLKPSDQRRGDVVVADRVYALHSGKETDDGFSSRPVSFPAPHRLQELVREVARDWRPSLDGMRRRPPRAHLKPIVAGEVVLAGENTELRRRIAKMHGDAAAIDMESFGTYTAAHRTDVPALAVRGLSDMVGDKQPGTDGLWQPRAARAAAAFLADLLAAAGEEDLGPAPTPAKDAPPSTAVDRPGALAQLPPQVRPWARRMAETGDGLDAALGDLTRHAARPAGWLGRLKHRPPAWLRTDATGDAWALVAAYADAHRSPAAAHAYGRAAETAAAAGHDELAGLHALRAALAAVRYPTDPSAPEDATRSQVLYGLDRADLTAVSPLAVFVRAAIEEDPHAIGPAGAAALTALGLPPGLAWDGPEPEPAEGAFEPLLLAKTDSDVHDNLRGEILGLVASAHLQAGRTDAALAALREARAAAPNLSGFALAEARCRLQRLAESPGPADVSGELADVEEAAQLVRRSRRRWLGPTADALAVAARARALTGDARGAMRMVRPRPEGDADDREAVDPDLAETGAACALAAGDARLSLDYAGRIPDAADRQLARGAALARLPGMAHEAQDAFRDSLARVSERRPDRIVRALIGLTALDVPLLDAPPKGLADHLDRLRRLDPPAADLVQAADALDRGRYRDATVLARRHPDSVPASHLAAEALTAGGDAAEAIRILERAAANSGDDGLLAHALHIAATAGHDDVARRLAQRLTTARSPAVRRDAVQALIGLAAQDGDWPEVARWCRQLLAAVEDSPPSTADSARWQLAAAEYNQRRFPQARQALDDPAPAVPRTAAEAGLLLAVLRAAPGPRPDDDVGRALDTAEKWPDDEQIGASVLALVATARGGASDDTLLVRARAQQEAFFTAFPDTALLQRVDVGEDHAGLIDHLRQALAPAAPQIANFARKAWLGDYPLAVLADVTRRSYAELLIRRDLGVVVVADGRCGDQDEQGAAAAEAALDSGTVVDLSALALLPDAHDAHDHVLAAFPRVVLPTAARDDLLAAASALALRSTGTMSWDSERDRPVFREHAPEDTEAWDRRAALLRGLLRHVEAVPAPDGDPGQHWDASFTLARALGLPLWADDAALVSVCRSEGVDVFGTLDLLSALEQRGLAPDGARAAAVDRLVTVSAVDLPVQHRLLEMARADEWRPVGYAALLLARPANWTDVPAGLARYRLVVRAVPDAARTPALIAGWFETAASGLAWTVPPGARARAVGALMAWTALEDGTAQAVPPLYEAAERVLAGSAPGSDLPTAFAGAATESLLDILDREDIAVAFTGLIRELPAGPRLAMMQAFLGADRA